MPDFLVQHGAFPHTEALGKMRTRSAQPLTGSPQFVRRYCQAPYDTLCRHPGGTAGHAFMAMASCDSHTSISGGALQLPLVQA